MDEPRFVILSAAKENCTFLAGKLQRSFASLRITEPNSGSRSRRRQVSHRLFVQKSFCRLHSGMSVKPFLHRPVSNEVRNSKQDHPLVMGHPRAYDLTLEPPAAMARSRKVH